MTNVDYVDGFTWHGRLGDLKNAFKYKVGFVLLDLDENVRGPAFFSRTSGNFFGIIDSDYGGPPGAGRSSVGFVRSSRAMILKALKKYFYWLNLEF